MASRIAIIQGHPDSSPERLCRALAAAYAAGAEKSGREVRIVDIAAMDFPPIRTQAEFERGDAPPCIAAAQETLRWADHWVIVYPLWLGDAPALFKSFVEQTFRPGFALRYRPGRLPDGLLTGKSARVIVTMAMPAFVYRYFFLAHGLRNLKRNILNYAGVRPVRDTLIGSVKDMSPETAAKWLAMAQKLGADGR